MSNNRNDSVITDMFGKAKHVADQAQVRAADARKKADEGVSKLGEITYKNRATIDSRIEQAEHFVVGKIGTRHSYKVSKVRDAVSWGLDRLADRRPAAHVASPVPDDTDPTEDLGPQI
ncbi:MAG TPA: hypothetical protein VFN73_00965 [Propionibacteriaceae bacterium]|nr:hypothetical protein [Propionibacteriaceae bacterium]